MPVKEVHHENIVLFGSTVICWHYPEIYHPKKQDSIILELAHIRSANNLHITFDAKRDGYVISQQTIFSWPLDDDICDPGWQEVAFIEAWQPKQRYF
jgi:hypothetical protein